MFPSTRFLEETAEIPESKRFSFALTFVFFAFVFDPARLFAEGLMGGVFPKPFIYLLRAIIGLGLSKLFFFTLGKLGQWLGPTPSAPERIERIGGYMFVPAVSQAAINLAIGTSFWRFVTHPWVIWVGYMIGIFFALWQIAALWKTMSVALCLEYYQTAFVWAVLFALLTAVGTLLAVPSAIGHYRIMAGSKKVIVSRVVCLASWRLWGRREGLVAVNVKKLGKDAIFGPLYGYWIKSYEVRPAVFGKTEATLQEFSALGIPFKGEKNKLYVYEGKRGFVEAEGNVEILGFLGGFL